MDLNQHEIFVCGKKEEEMKKHCADWSINITNVIFILLFLCQRNYRKLKWTAIMKRE
jgi:hypothetical protein